MPKNNKRTKAYDKAYVYKEAVHIDSLSGSHADVAQVVGHIMGLRNDD